jgi:hypothetical protein
VQTIYDNLSDTELIRTVDNNPNATDLERALAERLDMRRRDLEDAGNAAPLVCAECVAEP